LKIGSLTRSAATLPGLPRVTDAAPCSVATCPTSPVACSAPAGAGGFCARAANGQNIAGDVQIAANFLMKSRRFKLASEGFPTGGAGNQHNKSPRAQSLQSEAIVH
jgi:hypothetical protein